MPAPANNALPSHRQTRCLYCHVVTRRTYNHDVLDCITLRKDQQTRDNAERGGKPPTPKLGRGGGRNPGAGRRPVRGEGGRGRGQQETFGPTFQGTFNITASSSYTTFAATAANKEKFWLVLCEAIGRPEWGTDPEYASFADRLRNRNQLTEMLDNALSTRTTNEWMEIFAGQVPAAPVNDIAKA